MDLHWAGDINTRRSITSLALMLAEAPVAYKRNPQPTIAYITTVDELSVAMDYVKTVIHLLYVHEELGLYQQDQCAYTGKTHASC